MKQIILDGIGTGDGRTSGVIDVTANKVADALGIQSKWIFWKAAMAGVGGSGSWNDNAKAGVLMMVDEFKSTDEDYIILAYSGGNKVVHDFLDMYPEFHDRVVAVGFMSDPWRPKTRWQHGTPEPIGYGVMGERLGPIPDRSYWTSVHNDAISAAYPDALIRYAADVSDGDPDKIIENLISMSNLGKFQLAWQLGVVQRDPFRWFFGLGGRIGQMISDIHGYLNGRHTKAYITPFDTNDGNRESLAERLAETIIFKARKHV